MMWRSLRVLKPLLRVIRILPLRQQYQMLYLGWFVIESELNQKYLTVKEGNASSGQPVVNSSPKKNNQNQLWMWKDDNIVSKLDETFVLDGSFGIVSIQKKKHGNVFQKWRQFLFN